MRVKSKLDWLCPHCGEGKRYPMALCGNCMRFCNDETPNTADNRRIIRARFA